MSNAATIGRPSVYSPAIADEICRRIADGESLRAICRTSEHLPGASTILGWLASQSPEYATFLEQYTRARAIQMEMMAEETIEIADDGTNDWMERQGSDGQSTGWVLNGEHVQRSRLRIDTRKWFASKVAPKKYGDRLQVDDVSPPRPLIFDVSGLDPESLTTLATLIGEAQRAREPTVIGQSSTAPVVAEKPAVNGSGNGTAKPKTNGKAKR